MDRVKCFLLERTERAQVSYRRYSDFASDSCPRYAGTYSYHDRSVVVELSVPYTEPYEGRGDIPTAAQKNDPRWPKTCHCGYAFLPEDRWYINYDRLYVTPEGADVTPDTSPAGSMWFAYWYEANTKCIGPDGKSLMVMCPPGGNASDVWHVDGFAKSGGRWTRTGTPPDVTASPSILTPSYHGHLRNGYLEKC